ncbi:Cyclopropane-fatty-acyl-phospholipid synthase [Anaeromyxobacter sp. K]|uniref:SAM-dependent methyltransferase n=1 Tax=Anaeromyxobacter sp. (strain K) TaxID=447217 RepID=UPI00017BE1F4|nr:cyclopropane-fatty-acyl-phospholipid synthase family protein [Anaeromyxobacter sp. K]ACG72876.1 Cyclopropane-fatty-acyl-phospholipid synthase [Anaeromyxobacter sp. K]
MDPARVAAAMFDSESRTFAVRLWDGTLLPPARDAGVRGVVLLRDPAALDALVPPAAERRLAEAILDGRIELEGDAIALVEAAARWTGPRPHPALAAAIAGALARRALHALGPAPLEARLHGGRHSVRRDRDAVRHHYDVSDAFYRLFLGDDLVYSCAYFPTGREGLEEAQRAKLELVCRKLALAPGERFLDVGCGWGALIEHAAVRHGARATGITLSHHQLRAAEARAERLRGRADLAVRPEDYRTLRPEAPFDKVASVGMMEHVGRARLDAYFAAVHRLLRPGGLFLNHAIASVDGRGPTLPWAGQRGGGFIWRYVFPDGELVPIAEVIARAARAGFEVRDLECLREHYAETLAAWLGRLEERYGEAVGLVGERRARLYRLYLAASAAGFRLGRISVFQLLLARPDAEGRAAGTPRSRSGWYAERAAGRPGRARG